MASAAGTLALMLSCGHGYGQWEKGIVLRGTICTMNDKLDVKKDGQVLIVGNKIVAVLEGNEAIPAAHKDAVVIKTDGYIFPGLMDIHNHPSYNILPLWQLTKTYRTRYAWGDDPSYRKAVRDPYNYLWSKKNYKSLLGLYAEAKAIAGGTTTIQGLTASNVYGKYLVRNAELTNFSMDRISDHVMKLGGLDDMDKLRNDLASKLDAWFYHLAEGSDTAMRRELYDLRDNGLNLDPVVGIHCTALGKEDFQFMKANHMSMVWSPLSNLILYGVTADLHSAKENEILISLGSDWSPSGSKNVLWELKVAYLWNKNQLGHLFTPAEIVQMVTTNPAKTLKWEDKVGNVKEGMYADLVLVEKKDNDPYMSLIRSTEDDVELVIVDGRPYYGDVDIMQELIHASGGHGPKTVTDKLDHHKVIDIYHKDYNRITYDTMYTIVRTAMRGGGFPGGPAEPDPIYTGLDTEYFKRLWSVCPASLSAVELAAFVYPVGKANTGAELRKSPGGALIATLAEGAEVIVIKMASGRRRNWHEILAKTGERIVARGVVKKDQITIASQPD
jgi:transcription antitermination factor NusG